MPNRIFYILFLMLFIVSCNSSNAKSAKEEYELQEHCKKSGDACFYKWDAGEDVHYGDDWTTYFDHRNHYNKKLNKCFVLMTATIVHDNKEKRIPHRREAY